MKKQLPMSIGWLLVMVNLLSFCLVGCQSTQPESTPKPDQATAVTTTTKQASTVATTSEKKTTTTTFIDPMGYEDRLGSEEWPYRDFYSIEGFIHWIENPDFEIENTPYEPGKDENGHEIYKDSYFKALYPNYQQMFAVDRFYMLPDVPEEWELINIYVTDINVGFTYEDQQKERYHFSYVHYKPGTFDIENSTFLVFKKEMNHQEYYITNRVKAGEKAGWSIQTLVNGYFCEFSQKTYNPNDNNSATEGYDRVIYNEDTDLTDAVSKIKFKRIDLPPLK